MLKTISEPINAVLNRITMYRLVVYVLSLLAAIGIGASMLGRLSASPTAMVVSLFLLLGSAFITDFSFSKLFDVPTNNQSWLITALILFLIVHPATSSASAVALILGGAISSASKFLLARNAKHFFNPAALAATILGLTGLQSTTWWIGSAIFWPFTLVLGLLVVRKIRRFPMVLSFVATAIVTQALSFSLGQQAFGSNMKAALISSPLIFLATIMLTEPATMPPRLNKQLVFGVFVGILYATAWQIGPLIIYPEVALLLGNVYAYLVSPKFRLRLELQEVQRISDRVYNYVFKPDQPFTFLPGQYMEWTLAGVPYDSRGNRRTFTIASSPTENTVQLGIKYYEPASSFKAAMAQLQPGDLLYASQLGGNFTLGKHDHQKLALIAGGIGVTPFRSMVKYLTDSGIQSDVVVLYVVSDPAELAYMTEFEAARQVGVTTIPIITQTGVSAPGAITGKLSTNLLSSLIPDAVQRTFYISGPNVMVDATKAYLQDLGVATSSIKTDHFSGY
ncbi:RnfABCDGE type electron transport complex subunit D [Candidatus Saccharibacteria bacterium]|nr:RnfABCDGE type electron transport complex subunit D [Candidatus Saccharibacteria bacterium]